ncbi:hypothetical protein VZG28_03065 [Synechococcus elongatus IITB4]|uniref:hypothetical protein n=1 Tax=Synechococcus elongatus TaxID=32046 RepID=UPI0030CAD49D
MSFPQPPNPEQSSKPYNLFEMISALQITLIVIAILWGVYRLFFVEGGGYMGFGTLILIGVYLPSALLLLPTFFLIKKNRYFSGAVRVAGYCYYGLTAAWGLFLLRLPLM